MTTGLTLYDWGGKPALLRDGEAHVYPARNAGWMPGDAAVIRVAGLSIGRDEFDARFADWKLVDLPGWFQARDPDRPYDSYAKARAWASRQ